MTNPKPSPCVHSPGSTPNARDHTIVMADYYFAPSELTILPGETVAFINVQGTHDGVWNNPAGFYLEPSSARAWVWSSRPTL